MQAHIHIRNPPAPAPHGVTHNKMRLKQDLWLSAHFMDIAQAFALFSNVTLRPPLATPSLAEVDKINEVARQAWDTYLHIHICMFGAM